MHAPGEQIGECGVDHALPCDARLAGEGGADDAHREMAFAARVVPGVAGVFLGNDFVTVTKTDPALWDQIKPSILGAIMEHYQSGLPALADSAPADDGHSEHSGPDGDIVVQIKELLDTRVRPAVAQDGGDIVYRGFDKGKVFLAMQGACAGCPSSTLTLKMGIENLLRHYIPEVTEVRPVA